eukprot:364620-Chlamydomonas_euryale.AAC.3
MDMPWAGFACLAARLDLQRGARQTEATPGNEGQRGQREEGQSGAKPGKDMRGRGGKEKRGRAGQSGANRGKDMRGKGRTWAAPCQPCLRERGMDASFAEGPARVLGLRFQGFKVKGVGFKGVGCRVSVMVRRIADPVKKTMGTPDLSHWGVASTSFPGQALPLMLRWDTGHG